MGGKKKELRNPTDLLEKKLFRRRLTKRSSSRNDMHKKLTFKSYITVSCGLETYFEYHTSFGENQDIFYTVLFLRIMSRVKQILCVTSEWSHSIFFAINLAVDQASVQHTGCIRSFSVNCDPPVIGLNIFGLERGMMHIQAPYFPVTSIQTYLANSRHK